MKKLKKSATNKFTAKKFTEPKDRFFLMAKDFHQKGDLDRAAEFYIRSLQHTPSPRTHVLLGKVLAQFGEVEAAIEECRYALDLDPDCGQALNDLGAYLLEKRKYKEAEKYLVRACESKNFENKEHSHFNLARFYLHKGQLLRATKELTVSSAINPEFTAAKNFLNQIQNQLH